MAQARIKREKDFDNGKVEFSVVGTGDRLTCSLSDLSDDIVRRLAVHGLNAKVGDSAADPNVTAIEAMATTWNQLRSGDWSARGEGGGGPRVTLLAEALAKVTGQDLEAVVAKLEAMPDKEKKELRKHPQTKAASAEITAARAKERAKAAKKGATDGDPLDF